MRFILEKKEIANGEKDDDFTVHFVSQQRVEIVSATQLGLMYGVLSISRNVLKVDDFWYFMDKREKKAIKLFGIILTNI